MRTHFRHIFCLICIILFNEAIGQDPAHYYYDTDAGLPSSEVYDVEIDAKGNLWFATDRGISKYNGFTFQNFDASDGLTGNTVFEIIKSEDNELYFTCYNGSAFRIINEKFTPLGFNENLKELNLSSWIKQIQVNSDELFFQIFNYDPQKFNNKYYTYNLDNDSLIAHSPNQEKTFTIYGEGNNKFIYIQEYNSYTNNYIELENDEILLSLDSKSIDTKLKHDWINNSNLSGITFREYLKALRIDFNANESNSEKNGVPTIPSRIYKIKNNELITSTRFNSYIRRLFKDSKNNIWACTNNGLWRINEQLELLDNKPLFPNLDISSIIEDEEGSIWLTTINKGVVKIPSLYINQFRNVDIANSRVLSLISHNQKLYLSSHNGSINFFDTNLKLDKVEADKRHYNGLQRDTLGLYSNFNSQIAKEGSRYYLRKIKENAFGVREPFLRYNKDEILIGLNALKIYNPKKKISQAKDIYDFQERLTTLKYGKNNKSLFVGTYEGLYYSNDFLNKPFEAIYPKKLNVRISSIETFKDGFLISTLGKGLFYLKNNFELIHLTEKSTYPLKNINCIYSLDENNILIGTNKGLFKLILKNDNDELELNQISNYTINNGLSSNFIYSIEEFNNIIWLSTEKGVNYFKPEDFLIPINSPKIYLDSISTNTQINSLNTNIFSAETTELNFHITSFSSKKSTSYPYIRYRIEDQSTDTTWLYTNESYIPIYNLSTGHYKLIAQSRNDLFNWSSEPLIYNFTIKPKFYETLAFKIISIVLIILTILLSYKVYTVRALGKKENELKLKRVELKGKKAELDALRGQMNPHFIYNALNSIQNFIFNGDEEKASSYMSKISRLMRSSLEMSKLELISIEQEINFLKNYLDLEKMRFENKFDYNIDSSYQLLSCKIPPLLIQPLVENTIKHGFTKMENKKGQLYISFRNSGDKLIVTIEDNGVGLNASIKASNNKLHKSLSTTIIRERLDIINKSNKINTCKIIIENKLEKDSIKGVIAQLFLPLNTSYA